MSVRATAREREKDRERVCVCVWVGVDVREKKDVCFKWSVCFWPT